MSRAYTEAEQRNLHTVQQFFGEVDGPADKSELFTDDGVWWNGLPMIAGAEGQTEHRGRDAIRNILPSQSTAAPRPGGDKYVLSTIEKTDVVTIVDGDYVVRQQNISADTQRGQRYQNTYCFVFRFDDAGRIEYLTEHWNTWYAHKMLFDQYSPDLPTG